MGVKFLAQGIHNWSQNWWGWNPWLTNHESDALLTVPAGPYKMTQYSAGPYKMTQYSDKL